MLAVFTARPFHPQRGFTLLELLAVIVLIAVLSGIVIGAGQRASEAGRVARARAELAILAAALENYRGIYGDYPQTDDGAQLLQSLIGKRDPLNVIIGGRSLIVAARFATAESHDPFTDPTAVLIDPWDHPYVYVYRVPATLWRNPGFVLYSIGPDGRDSATLLPGGIIDPAPAENTDNIYANLP